jgi:hypothetical protein
MLVPQDPLAHVPGHVQLLLQLLASERGRSGASRGQHRRRYK